MLRSSTPPGAVPEAGLRFCPPRGAPDRALPSPDLSLPGSLVPSGCFLNYRENSFEQLNPPRGQSGDHRLKTLQPKAGLRISFCIWITTVIQEIREEKMHG